MNKTRMGFAMCGSFCTHQRVLEELRELTDTYDVIPIISELSAAVDTRFGRAEDFLRQLREITGHEVIATIRDAEPIGPKALLDVLVIAPCTGNTAAKLAGGITDSAVTMAAKAHLRNGRPVVIAISSNDGLSAGAVNIGQLLNRRHYYFVPFGQDNAVKKPCSLMADFHLIGPAVEEALRGRQLQPLLKA